MSEADELRIDLKAVYGELFPRRNPEAMPIGDDVLALGVLIRREMKLAAQATVSPSDIRRLTRDPRQPE